jgi:phosphatidylserine/phosphatidylglycerophosphate/cardiolipin synthase-like enzyme
MKRRRRGWSAAILFGAILLFVAAGLIWGQQKAAPVTPTSSSGATDWYQLYFTDPKYPDNPADHKGGIDTHLVDLMNSATKTIDVADYDFDLGDVSTAMAQATSRGVKVRMVTDTDTFTSTNKAVQAAFATLKRANIPIVDDQREAIMHNKFTVVDGEWISTGSWNYTDGDTYHLNNNMIVIHSADLAANYTNEFNKMFEAHDFGKAKAKTVPHPVLNIDGTSVQNCFAPELDCASLVVQTVNRAQQSIDFLAFSFTDDSIGNAMLARAQSGVSVSGVFETTGSQTEYSEYGKMTKAGLDVYTDGNPWSMHHKVIIVDDRIVIFGSFNYSESANTSNDENLLIVDNADLAHAFTDEFQRVLAVAKNPPTK